MGQVTEEISGPRTPEDLIALYAEEDEPWVPEIRAALGDPDRRDLACARLQTWHAHKTDSAWTVGIEAALSAHLTERQEVEVLYHSLFSDAGWRPDLPKGRRFAPQCGGPVVATLRRLVLGYGRRKHADGYLPAMHRQSLAGADAPLGFYRLMVEEARLLDSHQAGPFALGRVLTHLRDPILRAQASSDELFLLEAWCRAYMALHMAEREDVAGCHRTLAPVVDHVLVRNAPFLRAAIAEAEAVALAAAGDVQFGEAMLLALEAVRDRDPLRLTELMFRRLDLYRVDHRWQPAREIIEHIRLQLNLLQDRGTEPHLDLRLMLTSLAVDAHERIVTFCEQHEGAIERAAQRPSLGRPPDVDLALLDLESHLGDLRLHLEELAQRVTSLGSIDLWRRFEELVAVSRIVSDPWLALDRCEALERGLSRAHRAQQDTALSIAGLVLQCHQMFRGQDALVERIAAHEPPIPTLPPTADTPTQSKGVC